MAQANIVKQRLENLDEVRLYRVTRIDETTGEPIVEYFGATRYLVVTDDPDSDFHRNWTVGPLGGQVLAEVQNIFTRVETAANQREGL